MLEPAEDISVAHGFTFKFLIAIVLANAAFEMDAKAVSQETKQSLFPFLMPEDHPIKGALDRMFSSSRVILNLHTLKKAGFDKAKPRKFTKLIVTKHPAFPGYIFKIYLDAQRYRKGFPEYHYWLLRLQGAEKIRREIAERNLEHIFKVPKKWIYRLPKHPLPPEGFLTKSYILVAEDMECYPDEKNKKLWQSDYVVPELLDELHSLLTKVGLRDCAKPDNIPFCRDGRIAFIDTQSFGQKVLYKKLTPFLSESNKNYWKEIIKK